jgi:hypothetical protein
MGCPCKFCYLTVFTGGSGTSYTSIQVLTARVTSEWRCTLKRESTYIGLIRTQRLLKCYTTVMVYALVRCTEDVHIGIRGDRCGRVERSEWIAAGVGPSVSSVSPQDPPKDMLTLRMRFRPSLMPRSREDVTSARERSLCHPSFRPA